MNTTTAILDPDADGTVHVPVPTELRGGKVRVTATLQAATESAESTRLERVARREAALADLRIMGGLGDVIPDPVQWQREVRDDRPLPDRD